MPLNPTNQNKVGVLLPNPTAPRFDTAFAAGRRGVRPPLTLHPQNGTPDPTFNPETDITYLGSFRVPHSHQGSDAISTRDMSAFAYDAATNTFFMGKHNLISQFSIPELSMSGVAQDLNASQRLQSFTTFVEKGEHPDLDGAPNDRMGWMKIVGGKLLVHGHNYYDTGSMNQSNIFLIDNPYDLAGSAATGWISTGLGDKGSRYVMDIPATLQPSFNGFTHFIGVGADLAIVSRASFGHALCGISLGSISSSDTSTPSQAFAYYPLSNKIEGSSEYNEQIRNYYAALVKPPETSWEDFLDIPPSLRVNDFETLPKPDPSLYKNLMCFTGTYPLGFIPKDSNSVVFIGKQSMSRYGGTYKTRNLEHSGNKSGGPRAISATDVDNMIWTMNLNDVASAVNTYDPKYSSCGVFDNNRWMVFDESKNYSVVGGTAIGGEYHPDSNKLFVVYGDIDMDNNQFNSGRVVAVYQVGGA
jgi:hypothetical protein